LATVAQAQSDSNKRTQEITWSEQLRTAETREATNKELGDLKLSHAAANLVKSEKDAASTKEEYEKKLQAMEDKYSGKIEDKAKADVAMEKMREKYDAEARTEREKAAKELAASNKDRIASEEYHFKLSASDRQTSDVRSMQMQMFMMCHNQGAEQRNPQQQQEYYGFVERQQQLYKQPQPHQYLTHNTMGSQSQPQYQLQNAMGSPPQPHPPYLSYNATGLQSQPHQQILTYTATQPHFQPHQQNLTCTATQPHYQPHQQNLAHTETGTQAQCIQPPVQHMPRQSSMPTPHNLEGKQLQFSPVKMEETTPKNQMRSPGHQTLLSSPRNPKTPPVHGAKTRQATQHPQQTMVPQYTHQNIQQQYVQQPQQTMVPQYTQQYVQQQYVQQPQQTMVPQYTQQNTQYTHQNIQQQYVQQPQQTTVPQHINTQQQYVQHIQQQQMQQQQFIPQQYMPQYTPQSHVQHQHMAPQYVEQTHPHQQTHEGPSYQVEEEESAPGNG
jgi:hypothetical protein